MSHWLRATGAAPRLPAGSAPTTGLYPGDRYKSAFSSRRRAPAALATLLGRVASLKATAIVSYSVSSQGSDGNARMISLEELLVACRHVFGGRHVEMVCDMAAHIAPGCRLAGSVTVGDRTLVGVGSCVRPGINIGADCLIGAGSTVVKDIPAKANAFGNPAVIRTANPNDG